MYTVKYIGVDKPVEHLDEEAVLSRFPKLKTFLIMHSATERVVIKNSDGSKVILTRGEID